ncbi:hypothetical protein SAMN05444397_102182 [Flavobacterium aquidurense]|uniref:Tetratricopeptide repeat-containing protein n=1 Tax=Flavobacterium frigidimaris TaxID=262320 RepID=A0ABX4BT49_FLAFR|nr:hypothetical protein [Flavobacterium frigidimaris]OXA80414.1 hypothetical protein B0A65_07230 [Flavobacterium frigidimaris]SDY76364.1 hypothetical protein SAMN05444397_102182 [Flavobacterium aquidurense]
MKILYLLLTILSINSIYSQSQELKGKWILDKIVYQDGTDLEINNGQYSIELKYFISPNSLKINDQYFKANYSTKQIKNDYRIINYTLENNYLKIQEPNDNKISYFLKTDDFIAKYPEFTLQKNVRDNDTILVANELADYDFQKEERLDDFISSNKPDRQAKSLPNLYFQVEFILSKNNTLRDIKVLHSISKGYDNDYINALKKAEKFLRNNTKYDLLITKEVNNLKFFEDLTDPKEKELLELIDLGNKYYSNNNFENAITTYNKIRKLEIKNNRFKTTIENAYVKLGISYLASGNQVEACEIFHLVGNNTKFEVRNYINNFCK